LKKNKSSISGQLTSVKYPDKTIINYEDDIVGLLARSENQIPQKITQSLETLGRTEL